MLTKLSIKNFKRFEDVEIELGSPVVFVGPNNSGKTTALQAISLWYLGLQRWRGWKPMSGAQAVLNRMDLVTAPVPVCDLLWRNGVASRQERDEFRPIEIVLTAPAWVVGLVFHYENEESLTCESPPIELPPESDGIDVVFLPSMSGLVDREFLKQPDELNFLLGQGRTGELLRNLCYRALEAGVWDEIVESITRLFGVRLGSPILRPKQGISLTYRELGGAELDLICAGRGLQQTLLLLTFMALNPATVILLDEPDAHLEILRQRQMYGELTAAAAKAGSQIIVATHSEVILNEAADRDVVVSFVGKPHRIDDRGTQTLKALKEIGFEQYYEAEQRGWVLYLEGSTDLAILQAFARLLDHPAQEDLASPFVHYVENQPQKARDHFHGLREAKRDLAGVLICDRLDRELKPTSALDERMWRRREIENYLCQPETLLAFAGSDDKVMRECIERLVPPVALGDLNDVWWRETKATDAFLDRLFADYYERLGLPNLMRKSNYHRLAPFVPSALLDPEITEVLDAIHRQAKLARPIT